MKYISNIEVPKISIAPMVDRTDKHFRYFIRQITKESLLYTEMITAQAIIHGDLAKLLDFDKIEKPLALQIAGCNAEDIFKAVKAAEPWDYDEINFNVGCPSDRVSGNAMGAYLMAYPELVKEILCAMREATNKPVTLKHRIGIDGTGIIDGSTCNKTILNTYEDLCNFINSVEKAKIDRFTIHARAAILKGLSPRENREIPPLDYNMVYRLKEDFPYLNIELNGGIKTPIDIAKHLQKVDAVMIGRASYENPFMLREVDGFFEHGKNNLISRAEILKGIIPYMEKLENINQSSFAILKHSLDLFAGVPGSRQWKQLISPPFKDMPGSKRVKRALEELPENSLYTTAPLYIKQ